MRGVTKMQIMSIKTLAQFKYSNSTGNTSVFDINTSIITLNKTTTGTESCNAYHRVCAVNPSDVYEIAVLARKISGANGVLSVTETGGTIAGVVVSAAVASTNGVLQVTATDATTTNVTVKFSKVAL